MSDWRKRVHTICDTRVIRRAAIKAINCAFEECNQVTPRMLKDIAEAIIRISDDIMYSPEEGVPFPFDVDSPY